MTCFTFQLGRLVPLLQPFAGVWDHMPYRMQREAVTYITQQKRGALGELQKHCTPMLPEASSTLLKEQLHISGSNTLQNDSSIKIYA